MTLLGFIAMFAHGPLLTAHAVIGSFVLLLAVAAIFVRWARRATLYALVVQIFFGALVSGALKLPPPALHVLLALLVGGVYAMANAFERKGRSPAMIRGLLVLGALMLAAAYCIGEHALRA